MKLNYDCVRDVLLAVEKTETIDEDLSLTPLEVVGLFDRLPEYKDNEILYTVEKLKEAGYINAAMRFASGRYIDGFISSVTYSGHEYLDNIRDPKVWRKVKSVLAKAGAITMPLISQAAQALVGSQLNSVL